MKFLDIHSAIGAAILLLSLPCDAKLNHELSHMDKLVGKRHTHHKRLSPSPRAEGIEDRIQKRGTCAFPTNVGLVAVTPESENAGWAMSPDQACTLDSYCPYACPPGQVMAQWSPAATSYTYPESMAGGLYCDTNGQISKPFPDQPYCVDGTGTVGAQNNAGQTVSFCQTVLPGNEAMLIPTPVDSSAQLAVPGPDYWCGTASHFYVNPPGIGPTEACVWSDGSKPIGNWSPYVAGANTDSSGLTYVKIGWNPEYTSSWLQNTVPTWGIKIVCSGSGCNGTPCSIDPSAGGVGAVTSTYQSTGAGGANFCVVTVPKGGSATIEIFSTESSTSGTGASAAAANNAAEATSTSATPTSTSTTPATSSQSSTKTTGSSSTSGASSPSSTNSFKFQTSTYGAVSSSSTYESIPGNFLETQTGTLSVATATGKTVVNATSTVVPVKGTEQASAAPENLSSGSIFSLIVMIAVAGILL